MPGISPVLFFCLFTFDIERYRVLSFSQGGRQHDKKETNDDTYREFRADVANDREHDGRNRERRRKGRGRLGN